MKRILIIPITLTLSLAMSPIALNAMDQSLSKRHPNSVVKNYTEIEKEKEISKDTDDTKNIYVAIIAQMLNRLKIKKHTEVYPIARTTMIYALPHNYTDNDTFEYVDSFDDINPINPLLPTRSTRIITAPMHKQPPVASFELPTFKKGKQNNIVTWQACIKFISPCYSSGLLCTTNLGSLFNDRHKEDEEPIAMFSSAMFSSAGELLPGTSSIKIGKGETLHE